MTTAFRVKSLLFSIAVVLSTTLAWNAAQGQMRPPNPGMRPPGGMGGMNQPGGMGGMNRPGGFDGGMGIGWRCPKCGQTGEGMVPPQTCPGCGVRFMNGMGNGSAGGLLGNPQGGPLNPNPQGPNSGVPPANRPPIANQPPVNNGGNFVPRDNSSDVPSPPRSKKTAQIVVAVAVMVLGVVVLSCGAFLVFSNLKSNDSRRRRRGGYDN